VKSIKLFSYLISAITLIALVSGCAAINLTMGVPDMNVPEMKLASEMPEHAQQIARAVTMRLLHLSEKKIIAKTNVSGSGRIAWEENYNYKGFQVQQVKFRDHLTYPEQPELNHVMGFIHMLDDVGRNASVSFAVEYHLNGKRVKSFFHPDM